MKNLKYLAFAILSIFVISCDKDENTPLPADELSGLLLIQEIEGPDHTIELYSASGKLPVGHNKVFLRFRKKADNTLEKNAEVSWMPMMKMMSMNHACPYGAVTKVAGKETLFSGDIVFQMPGNDMESWELTITYNIGGSSYTAKADINVENTTLKRVSVFKASDSLRYIVALIDPVTPKVGINEMTVGIYRMQSMMSFPAVENYQLTIDPRMPGMGNHGSPNNENPLYNAAVGVYKGKLSLSMTGYWKINLVLKNDTGNILMGEAIEGAVESSSIYFEVDF